MIRLWQDLSDHILPRRSRFLTSERNKIKQNEKIINSTPRRSQRVLASGMMAGVTSPARPWFRFTTPDLSMMDNPFVQIWLWHVEERIRMVLARSNVYNCLHNVYNDLGTFGTAALHIEEDAEDLVRGYNYPIGQYALQTSPRLSVDTVYREQLFTVDQLVRRFGYRNCSSLVQNKYDRHELDSVVEVLHVIQPNRDHLPKALGHRGKPYRSVWMEIGQVVKGRTVQIGDDNPTGFLLESGYYEFPILCPRWDVNGDDVYGSSPGMDAIGDCKALQHLERRKAQLVDKATAPPMVGPSSILNRRISLLAGDYNPIDNTANGQKVEAAMVVQPATIQFVNELIQRHEERIEAAYYADLWLMLAESDRREITAREVAERHEEKMLQLGPVLERLQDELLDPLIDRVFGILLRGGHIPPPPPEIQDVELKIEYVSILTQAQKLLMVTSLERTAGFAIQASQARPDILDLFDWDEFGRQYANSMGLPPQIVLPSEEVAKIREARAKQQQAQVEAEQAALSAGAARDLSQSDPEKLAQLAQQWSPGASGLRALP
jgi:hypothetical protein